MTAAAAARPRWIATMLVVIGMGLLAYASLRVGIGLAAAATDPAVSLAWAPGNAWALRRRAEDRLQADRSPAGLAAAARDARAALDRQLLEPGALRTLGLVAELGGQETKGAGLLGLAQRMSRRDTKTQLWFAGKALAAGDLAATLHHYDIALRTSDDARPLLYPILCRALAERATEGGVAGLIAATPNWTDEFVTACSEQPGSRAALGRSLVRSPQILRHASADARARLVAGLAHDRDYGAAFALYRASISGPAPDAASLPRQTLPPFDWTGANEADLLASPTEQDRIYLLAEAGRSGTLATRLVLLPPGPHRLSAGNAIAGLEWTLSCDGRDGAPLAQLEGAGGNFVVPAGCPASWLTLSAEAGWPSRREGMMRVAIR